jgi:hypothetical protein
MDHEIVNLYTNKTYFNLSMSQPTCLQATAELRRILFHSAIALLFAVIQRVGYKAILPIALVSFCNALCLAERFAQRRTVGQWWTRIRFLTSRESVLAVVFLAMAVFLLRGA